MSRFAMSRSEAGRAASGRTETNPAGMGRPRALNLPRPARVRSEHGNPIEVNGERIESMRESWLVEDRWWTDRPLRRRYWELVSSAGRNLIVFHDLCAGGGWFTQSA